MRQISETAHLCECGALWEAPPLARRDGSATCPACRRSCDVRRAVQAAKNPHERKSVRLVDDGSGIGGILPTRLTPYGRAGEHLF